MKNMLEQKNGERFFLGVEETIWTRTDWFSKCARDLIYKGEGENAEGIDFK